MKKIVKNHVKKGDQVKVISGDQKGFLGIISSVVKKKSSVILAGLAPRIKNIKNSKNKEEKKIELPILIHISNVMLCDKKINKANRIGYQFISSNSLEKNITSEEKVLSETTGRSKNTKILLKRRYFKKSGNLIEE